MKRPTIKPSDFRAEAQRLIRDGKMPTLKQVLDTIGEVKRRPAHVPMRDFDDDDAHSQSQGRITMKTPPQHGHHDARDQQTPKD